MRTVLVSWSGGKDSSLALHAALGDPDLRVAGLFTTVTERYDRISIHGVRRELLRRQARAVGLPLIEAGVPPDCSNEQYEAVTRHALGAERERGVDGVVFGDLFLTDIRAYRERLLAPIELEPLFPLWGRDTARLAAEFVGLGFRAVLCSVDTARLDAAFCGRDFDHALLVDLPAGVDPCGENGEFHTFVHAGPILAAPIPIERGEEVERDGMRYCDLTTM